MHIFIYIQIYHVYRIYLSFSVWVISLSIILSNPIHVVANDKISRFIMAE